MQIIGYVTEEQARTCQVTIFRSAACGDTCGKACATCKGASTMRVVAENGNFSPKLGEQVVLESKTNQVLYLASIVYILPIIVAVLGYYLGSFLGFGEGGSALMALLGLAVGFIPAFATNRKIAKSEKPAHTVVDILHS